MSRNPSTQSHASSAAGSSATLEAAYQGVFSQLDALANQSLSLSSPSPPASPAPGPSTQPAFTAWPSRSTGALGLAPLTAISERTEPISAAGSIRSLRTSRSTGTLVSPARDGSQTDFSVGSLARRFPLPPSPVKGPRSDLSLPSSVHSTPRASPKKASDLIKMFESKGSGPPPPQPSFAPAAMSRTSAFATASAAGPGPSSSSRISATTPIPAGARPPVSLSSAFGKAQSSSLSSGFGAGPYTSYRTADPQKLPEAPRPSLPPFKPARSPSPIANFRSMVATWRARAGSSAQRETSSPGRGGSSPGLFGRDRTWNMAIRRRKQDEQGDRSVLAETTDEPESTSQPRDAPFPSAGPSGSRKPEDKKDEEEKSSFGRSISVSSFGDSEPRQLTGEVCPEWRR